MGSLTAGRAERLGSVMLLRERTALINDMEPDLTGCLMLCPQDCSG